MLFCLGKLKQILAQFWFDTFISTEKQRDINTIKSNHKINPRDNRNIHKEVLHSSRIPQEYSSNPQKITKSYIT